MCCGGLCQPPQQAWEPQLLIVEKKNTKEKMWGGGGGGDAQLYELLIEIKVTLAHNWKILQLEVVFLFGIF